MTAYVVDDPSFPEWHGHTIETSVHFVYAAEVVDGHLAATRIYVPAGKDDHRLVLWRREPML